MRGTLLRWIAAALVGCGCWGAAMLAAAQEPPARPLVVNGPRPVPLDLHARSWIEEDTRRDIDEVASAAEALPWQPRQPGQVDRIQGKALWIQFDVQVDEPHHWFLELGAAGIQRAQLFYRDAQGQWVVQESSDSRAVAQWPVPGRFPVFPLAVEQDVAKRYWLRIEQDRADYAAPLTLYRETTLLAQRQREQFLLGGYFGISLLLAVAALATGIAWRDRAFLAFAVYIVAVAGGQLARAGVGAQHLWPTWTGLNEVAVLAWPGIPVAAALWFVKVVADPARLAPGLEWLLWALMTALLASVAVDAVLRERLSMVVVLVMTGLCLAAIVAVMVWGLLDGRDPDLKLVALGFLPLVVLALAPLARGFNLIPMSGLTRYAVFAGTLATSPLLYYALQARSMRRRESELRAAALSHTDPLTGLPHRRAFTERLETALARARSHRSGCAVLGVRVVNLQQIAAEFGRDTAEKAIVVAASHLRRVCNHADVAARVDEEHFALLLESPVTGEQAISRAQQVIASGLRPSPALPAGATLRFAVTVAVVPHEDLNAEATLRWALHDLASIPADARKLIRSLNIATAA